MRIYFIRHSLTKGGTEKRYIGRTDEPLCEQGIQRLGELSLPRCDALVCSPMLRCVQTAELLFPGQEIILCEELRECDFGDFEGHNYDELNGREDYQRWIDSGGRLTFPNGEAPSDFKRRCISGFERIVPELDGCESAAFVVHGGTIMSLLERFALPHRDYYDWLTEHCGGWLCEYDGAALSVIEKL